LKAQSLTNLESFTKTAEAGSFTAAARRLHLTPAAVSRNIATLERGLGVRLFQRSTRRLTLTEQGAELLRAIGNSVETLRTAMATIGDARNEPAGLLKVSMSPLFGLGHILPLLPAFRARYPKIQPEWHFENRQVDLIGEGFDAAIGGGLAVATGLITRTLAPAHLVAVASPKYLRKRRLPTHPTELIGLDGLVMRSARTGRLRQFTMRDRAGTQVPATLEQTIVFNEPTALCVAARMGLGVAFAAVPDVLADLRSGALVRLVPGWYVDAGSFQLYYANRTLQPARVRVFVDFVVRAFARGRLARRFSAAA
jgi:DNA-binding transcriptional LysR family regulator